MKNTFLFASIFLSTNLLALPIDWHGQFGASTILQQSSSYLDLSKNSSSIGTGSQEIDLASSNNDELSTQVYLFTLNPVILVNDAVTLHSEFTTGYARGGRFGDNSSQSKKASATSGQSNILYPHNFSGTDSSLIINKLYMELFTDSATYLIGRYYDHFGLGAVVNDGAKPWDHFATTRDGFMLKVQLGNFHINPFWSRLVSGKENADGTKIKEFGASLIYDNMDRDIALGVLFSKKIASDNNTFLNTRTTGTSVAMGKTDTTLIDLYLKKKFDKLEIAIEAPFFSGNIGTISQNQTEYDANALLAKIDYQLSDVWKIGLDFGKVSGDAGSKSKFSAMYLNPNFQIANILFRYNRHSLADGNANNLFDSYVNNVMFLKLKSEFLNDEWTWNFNIIYAQAVEVAKSSSNAFNHLNNTYFVAVANQEKNMGLELDIDFNYAYNEELSFQGNFGYLKSGDYFAFTNTTTANITKDAYVISLGTNVSF